jgi:hypothetical protein
VIAAVALVLAPLYAFAVPPRVGDFVEGEITKVDLVGSPRHIVISYGDENVKVRVKNSTKVIFENSADAAAFSPELSNLEVGMFARARFLGDDVTSEVVIKSVPQNLRDQVRGSSNNVIRNPSGVQRSQNTTTNNSGNQLKVRVIDIDQRRGEFKADVAGQARTFIVDDTKLLARMNEGDLIVITVSNRNGRDTLVTDVQGSSITGRVTDVNRTAGEIRVLVDGREEVYKADRKELLDIRTGELISFQTEERSNGTRVIVSIDDF